MTQEEMTLKLVEVDNRSRSNTRRINELSGQIEAVNRLATAVEVMATKQDTLGENVERLTDKVDALESKPAKRWDGLVDKVILTIVAALVGFALARLGVA